MLVAVCLPGNVTALPTASTAADPTSYFNKGSAQLKPASKKSLKKVVSDINTSGIAPANQQEIVTRRAPKSCRNRSFVMQRGDILVCGMFSTVSADEFAAYQAKRTYWN